MRCRGLEGLRRARSCTSDARSAKSWQSQALEFFAHLVDAFGLRRQQAVDHGAAMRDDVDQALGLELAQRLAHQRAAHAGHLAQLALEQPLAGPKWPRQMALRMLSVTLCLRIEAERCTIEICGNLDD